MSGSSSLDRPALFFKPSDRALSRLAHPATVRRSPLGVEKCRQMAFLFRNRRLSPADLIQMALAPPFHKSRINQLGGSGAVTPNVVDSNLEDKRPCNSPRMRGDIIAAAWFRVSS